MAELYTMQRYLQYDDLKKNELEHFDNWASTFGETITAIELSVMKVFHQKNNLKYQKVA
jgi:N12 class adenine-specific DNA methylase